METLRRNFTTLRSQKFSSSPVARNYYIDLVDYYPHLKDWYMTAEPETYQWVLDNAEPYWTCIEVGGHVGEMALLLSQLTRVVFSFEPNPASCAKFHKNIEYNQRSGNGQFLNVQLIPRPVGQYDGVQTEKLWLTGKDTNFGETIGEFDFVSLDTFVRCRDDISHVHFIFTDADGWDYDVLLGSEFIVSECRPHIIIEANYALGWRSHTLENIHNWAAHKKYSCLPLDAACPGNMLLKPEAIE